MIACLWNIILPGTGQILVRKYTKGTVLALLFAVSADIFLSSKFLLPYMADMPLTYAALAVAAAVWLFAQIDLAVRLKSMRAKDFQSRKDELLKAAQVAWLRDDYPLAEKNLRQILSLDERDIEAWVHLGKMLKSRGRTREARTCFLSALHLDGSGAWKWTLEEDLTYGDSGAEPSDASS